MIEQHNGTIEHDLFQSILGRARAEYLEMPGLKLTLPQAARLWALDSGVCTAVLTALVESRFLVMTRDAFFMRAS